MSHYFEWKSEIIKQKRIWKSSFPSRWLETHGQISLKCMSVIHLVSFFAIFVNLKWLSLVSVNSSISASTQATPSNPCVPSPCGPNSQCREVNGQAACSCLPNYVGRAPNCRPECTYNGECSNVLACKNLKCVDPCPGSCGFSAICRVVNHNAVCSCQQGYVGDPAVGCRPAPPTSKPCYMENFCLDALRKLFSLSLFVRKTSQHKNHVHHPSLIFSLNFFFSDRKNSSKSLLSFTLWPERRMSGEKRSRSLLLFTGIRRRPVRISQGL